MYCMAVWFLFRSSDIQRRVYLPQNVCNFQQATQVIEHSLASSAGAPIEVRSSVFSGIEQAALVGIAQMA